MRGIFVWIDELKSLCGNELYRVLFPLSSLRVGLKNRIEKF